MKFDLSTQAWQNNTSLIIQYVAVVLVSHKARRSYSAVFMISGVSLLALWNWNCQGMAGETSTLTDSINATLRNTDLWKKFNELGTEMIITKSGRLVSLQYIRAAVVLFNTIVWLLIVTAIACALNMFWHLWISTKKLTQNVQFSRAKRLSYIESIISHHATSMAGRIFKWAFTSSVRKQLRIWWFQKEAV